MSKRGFYDSGAPFAVRNLSKKPEFVGGAQGPKCACLVISLRGKSGGETASPHMATIYYTHPPCKRNVILLTKYVKSRGDQGIRRVREG